MILKNPSPSFKVTPFFDAEYVRNGTTYRHSFNNGTDQEGQFIWPASMVADMLRRAAWARAVKRASFPKNGQLW